MADLSNLKISNTFSRLLQADPDTNQLQDGVGSNPSTIIFNGTTLKYVDGNQQNNYILTSDANGVARWAENSGGGGSTDVYWSANTDGSITPSGLTTNIGLGTTTPNKPLTVVGDISASTNVYSNNLVLKANAGGTSYGQITPDVNHGTIKFMTKPPGTSNNGETVTIGQDLIEFKLSPTTNALESYLKLQPVDGGQDQIVFNDSNNDIDFLIKATGTTVFKLDAANGMMAFRDHVGIGYSSDKWPTTTGQIGGTPTYQLRVAGQTFLSGITTPLEVVGGISGTTFLKIGDGDGLISAATVSAPVITGTLSTAAQTNITSLGTLTNLDVDNININGNIITASADMKLVATGNDIEVDTDNFTIESATGVKPSFTLKSTVNSNKPAVQQFVKDKGAAGADGDFIGETYYIGDNDAQEQIKMVQVTGQISDASDGAEEGEYVVKIKNTAHPSSPAESFKLTGNGALTDATIGYGATSTTTIAGNLVVTGNTVMNGTLSATTSCNIGNGNGVVSAATINAVTINGTTVEGTIDGGTF
jgi:hypothetical protein